MSAYDSGYTYDVFICYNHADKEWVCDWLLSRLEETGLAVFTDQEFSDVGVPSLVNMERDVGNSCYTLLTLTPTGWTH